MMALETAARTFWCAASYYRRVHDRDRSMAVAILADLVKKSTGRPRDRAAQLLREINGTDEPPASA